MNTNKEIKVPFWLWNLFWFLTLLGADNLFEAIGAALAIWIGFHYAKEINAG